MRVSPLRAAIQDKKFAPAYYFFGEDEFLKEEGLRQLLSAAVDPATRDFNLDQRRGADLDAETLGSLLAMPPMMADRRVVVIRDVTALRKDARGVLDKCLQSPAADLLVVLTAPAESKEDKLLAERTVPIECEAPSDGMQSTVLDGGGQGPLWLPRIVVRPETTFVGLTVIFWRRDTIVPLSSGVIGRRSRVYRR